MSITRFENWPSFLPVIAFTYLFVIPRQGGIAVNYTRFFQFTDQLLLRSRIMTIYLVALLFATLTLGVSSPRVSLHRWLLFTIRAQGKDGEEDLNKLSVINSNSCRNMVFFVIMIETFDF